MVIRVYISSTSGNMEIKKNQEHIRQVLEARKIEFEEVDIAAPDNESEKQFMKENAQPEAGKNFVLPPQIFNKKVYCGDHAGFQDAVEIDNLPEFLKLESSEPWRLDLLEKILYHSAD